MLQDRRKFLVLLAGAWATPALAQSPSPAARAQALSPEMSRPTAYAFSFKRLEGGDLRLGEHAGKPILVVNTASLCGYTPQYEGLQQLWTRFRDKGLLVIGVPSNDFGGQEPGGLAEIGHTAHGKYGVTFPLAEKVTVKGATAHPFFKWAAGERPLEVPRWNFINTWSAATAILPPPSPPTSNRRMPELWRPSPGNCGPPQVELFTNNLQSALSGQSGVAAKASSCQNSGQATLHGAPPGRCRHKLSARRGRGEYDAG